MYQAEEHNNAPQASQKDEGNQGRPESVNTVEGSQKGTQTLPGATNSGASIGKVVKNITPQELEAALLKLNARKNDYFNPDTLSVNDWPALLSVTFQARNLEYYTFSVEKSESSGITIFLTYNDDEKHIEDQEEFIEAWPSAKVRYSEISWDGNFAAHQEYEIIGLKILEMIDLIDGNVGGWNKDRQAAEFTYFGYGRDYINFALTNYAYIKPEFLETLDAVMESSALEEDLTVYAGFRLNPLLDTRLLNQINAGDYKDQGFLTTYSDKETARSLVEGYQNYAMMEITLPAGTKCYQGTIGGITEITLPRKFDLSTAQWKFKQ